MAEPSSAVLLAAVAPVVVMAIRARRCARGIPEVRPGPFNRSRARGLAVPEKCPRASPPPPLAGVDSGQLRPYHHHQTTRRRLLVRTSYRARHLVRRSEIPTRPVRCRRVLGRRRLNAGSRHAGRHVGHPGTLTSGPRGPS